MLTGDYTEDYETMVPVSYTHLDVYKRQDCDGCVGPVHASIDFIAAQAEYTPPVIYSHGSREKLVFRVEAVPDPAQAATLRPGLPVDVRLAPH